MNFVFELMLFFLFFRGQADLKSDVGTNCATDYLEVKYIYYFRDLPMCKTLHFWQII